MRYRDERGVAIVWAVVATPILLLITVLLADLMRWKLVGQELQTAVDAAALAGGQELYVEKWRDNSGTSYYTRTYLDAVKAKEKGMDVLDKNLAAMRPGDYTFAVISKDVTVVVPTGSAREAVRSVATIDVKSLLAGSLGILPPQLSRTADAEPQCVGTPCTENTGP